MNRPHIWRGSTFFSLSFVQANVATAEAAKEVIDKELHAAREALKAQLLEVQESQDAALLAAQQV